MRTTTSILAILALCASAGAQWTDDFNRPDGPIGGDWTVVSGAWAIASQQGTHTSTSANEILQHNSASSVYNNAVCVLDCFATNAGSQFSGVLIGLGGVDSIMVKVQDQLSTTGGFTNIGIYHRSGSGWAAWTGNGMGFGALTSEFLSCRLTVHFPSPDLLVAEIDENFDGVPEQTYTKDNVLSIAANLGTGFGISCWGSTALFDNFGVNLGGSPPVVTYCTAGTSTNGCVPSLSASGQPSVSQAAPCILTVANVEGQKSGLVFYGIDNSGFSPLPWHPSSTSFFCVKSPVQRTPAQSSGGTLNQCNGQLSLAWDAFHAAFPGSLGTPFSVGDKVYVQAWYRDPPAPRTTNLSDAVELTHVP
jgi:hypothetical protein